MVKRREFLGLLTAVSGSYVLSACGGGGGGDGDGKGTSAGVTTSATSSSTSAASGTTSTTGTTGTTGTTSATGSTGATQSNATSSGSKGNNGASNTSNTSNNDASGSALASADGTAIPPAASVIDNQAAVWTVVGGSVYRNGAKAGNTFSVSLLLWSGGVIYH
ncbi:cobalamin biosynthesis Mg chelatase CobN [Paraburkholderia graminis]|nr:cobalamin biosynthesis Mg chelatase CobN [Paraburkholderia graminis]